MKKAATKIAIITMIAALLCSTCLDVSNAVLLVSSTPFIGLLVYSCMI